ncbi:hypothetical protein A2334_04240 [Candidatus Roizmanbacteria bacterium RIFOXYB2_FULL_38_10]|uniref:DUF2029 domain-containing protein n=1 Tax=Candidatus Roizmanbacteria bacterium RIFOXYD1_FULL_38_12 TaxID=1802093 RepID=A0A1F7KZD2_9BACT|nr:MAG: hypothetical protein A3K47_00350 [Candidatus Roizmanbacteria bacterium RIFOXYA2_FULL_38_14]OGK63252.1 MAG: hypothetical protein A3K27_00350 [Candidatus Roizmanbacteria bacterium RIFOXYA1_FULL_37_12]OGK65098.1 MAG: hypothetical protein A3K38_00350 [Candidatus Roizmanbacteria bacterium RIFOXYB1_FULL_40_23]OGK68652.1 MAG: hypothetical protein A2334_04240 [Candidatus Roizmanbacteria bacterium RIFOXYB2_FULL_38_10]OGK69502.1 MAG: hypothetical protein A3K21_00350 [Candidatus Roizmanbacteria ba
MKTKLPSKRYRIVAVIFSFFVFVHLAFSLQKILTSLAPDFSIFYYSTVDFMRGINPYTDIHLYTVYNYPPLTNTLYLPLVLLPYHVSQALFIMLSFISVFIIVYFSMKLSQLKLNFEMYITVVSLVLLSFPTKFTLGMGQSNLIAYALLLIGLYLFEKNIRVGSSVLIGLAILFKPMLVLILLVFFINRKWKELMMIGVFIGVFACIVLWWGRGTLFISFFQTVLPKLFKTQGIQTYYNQSFSSFVARLTTSEFYLRLLSFLCNGTLLAYALIFLKKNKANKALQYGFILTVLVIINNLSWQHHFIVLIYPFIFCMKLCLESKSKIHFLLLLFTYLLVSWNFKNPIPFSWFPANLLLSHQLYGAIIIASLLAFSSPQSSAKNI